MPGSSYTIFFIGDIIVLFYPFIWKEVTRVKRFEQVAAPFGMAGVVFYLIHTGLGRILWPEYNPVTMDISSLTAQNAPNADLLRVFTTIYGICMLVFVAGMIAKAFRQYNRAVRAGYLILIAMELVSVFGYALFPLTGDKTVMTFQNMMHIVVTVIVVFTTIASGFFLAAGYRKEAGTRKLGNFLLVMAILITVAGMSNPIGMGAGLNILGLTERLVIYSVQLMIFVLSAYYTFGRREAISR